MRKLVIGMQTKRGFTLIEILVVVVIIGITIGFALLAFGDFGGKRRIQVAAEQFKDFSQVVRQQAIYESSTFAIKVTKSSYQALRFEVKGGWRTLPGRGIFHERHFPSNAIIDLDTPGKILGAPDIIISSSGDVTPFTLYIGTVKEYRIATVIGTADGSIKMKSLPPPR